MNVRRQVRAALRSERAAVSSLEKLLTKSFFDGVGELGRTDGKILVTGVGKSSYIAMKIAATLTSLGKKALFLNPLDALHGDSGIVAPGDAVIAISHSGESAELVKVVRHLRKAFRVKVYAITGRAASSLASHAHRVFAYKIAGEGSPNGLAPMASTTAALVIGDLIAAGLTDPKVFTKAHFAKFHPGGHLGLSLTPVGRIMRTGRALPSVSTDAPLALALRAMTRGGLGAVAITTKSGALVGVITDGDVRRALLEHDAPKKLPVSAVMTRHPKRVRAGTNLKDALALMERYKIMTLFVVGPRETLLGALHMHDIVEGSLV